MLPTKGYFQDIECPYSNSYCGRPYCHFRHKKKLTDTVEEIVNDPEKEDSNIIPVYNPTPKSELANIQNNRSHIPISYVPDIVIRPERKTRPVPKFVKPTYKPTPLSILSSASKKIGSVGDENGENLKTIKEIKQNIANVEYDPTTSLQSPDEIDFEELDSEFAIIDEIIRSDSYKKKPKFLRSNVNLKPKPEENIKSTSVSNCSKPELLEDKINKKGTLEVKKIQDNNDLDRNKKAVISRDKEKDCAPTKSETNSVKCKEQSDEKQKEIVVDKYEKRPDFKKDKTKDKSEESNKQKKSDSKSKDNFVKNKTLEKCKDKEDKKDKEKNEKTSEKMHKSSSSRDKHRKEELKDRHEKKSKSRDKEKSPNNTKSRSRSRERVKSNEKKRKIEKSPDKPKNKERTELKQKSKAKDSSSDKRKSKEAEEHKTKSKKDEREKSKERKEKKSKEKSEDKRKIIDHSEDRHKTKDKSKESTDKSKTKSKHDQKKTDKLTEKNKKYKSKNKSEDEATSEKSASDSEYEPSFVQHIDDFVDVDFDEDEDQDQTMLECYKIFNEYKPPSKSAEFSSDVEMFSPEHSSRDSTDLGINDYTGKKRVAHTSVDRTYSQLHPPEKPKSAPTPGQTLSNRYKLAKLAQANREQELLINEVQQSATIKRPAPTLLEAARARKIRKEQPISNHVNTNVVDDILKGINNKTVPLPRPKIAPAQNVSLMAKAKERISKIAQAAPKTIAHTQKGPRVAHIPDNSLAEIPDVLQADRSKLPVNVRTRFLTMLADECIKLYISKDEAYSRALNEEFACYEKCNVLATYRNSAMLAVNRLRKEVQERNSSGLGLIGVGEDDGRGSGAEFSGKRFYNKIKEWSLTEEELDIHGYPRESDECQGKAFIKNPRYIPPTNLGENERLCSRCKKIYMVDDDGWPLYEEECLYHPLKKRTIRGEQTYLCCRSSDDTGCATSDTHVSEGFSSTDLEGYQTTMEPDRDDDPRSYTVYALDCEMCYTTKGLELTRVTVVDSDCKTVYESLVKPLNPIIDYNTRFSGITKEQMDRTSTSILQVQANILHLCNSNTILVGHSLESDMKALKIVHSSIVDTSVLFPHKMGLPHKRALKALASEYLRKIIQNNVSGHDSAEDAVTCMELLKWKLKEEAKLRSSK